MESNHPRALGNNVSDVIMRRHVFSRESQAYGSIRFPPYLQSVRIQGILLGSLYAQ